MRDSWHLASATSTISPSTSWIAIGVTIFIPSAVGVWVFHHLRPKTFSRLRPLVEIAKAGLTEEALKALQILQEELARLLPGTGEIVNPEDVIFDPSHVEANAVKGIDSLKRRDQLPLQFNRLLTTCKCLGYGWAFYALSLLITLATYIRYTSDSSVWHFTARLTIVIFGVDMLLLLTYAILNSKIQKSIELANPWMSPRRDGNL